jgi:hypothetical protein
VKATSSSQGLWWFTRKPSGYSVEPQSRGRRPGVAVRPKPACPVWRTGLTGLGLQGAGSFEAEDTHRDRKACVEATRSAATEHLSDGATKTIPKVPLVGVNSSLGFRRILVFRLSSI